VLKKDCHLRSKLETMESLPIYTTFEIKILCYRLRHAMASAASARMHVSGSDTSSRNVQNGSAFHEYPPSRPFVHDDYRRDVAKPIIAFPESNRQGMIHLSCQ